MSDSQPVTVAWLVEELQRKLGHDDPTMAEWLALESASVLKAIKTGKLRYPVNRVRQLAELLESPPGEILRLILRETDHKLLDAIEVCMGPLQLSDAEVSIINAIRKVSVSKELVPITFDRDAIVTLIVQGR